MEGFKATLINELEKLRKKKKAVAILIISIIVIIFGQLIVIAVRSGFGLGVVKSTEFPMLVLAVLNYTILPLFTALVAVDIFTGEFAQKTMKIALTRPVTRLNLFFAKITALAVFIIANLITVMVLSLLTGFIFNSASADFSSVIKVLISYFVSFFPAMIIALFVVVLANIFKHGTSALFMGIILFIGCKALGIFFPQISGVLFTSMMDWYKLWIAATLPVFKIVRQFFIMLGYAIMFFTAGFYLFDKKDI